ncbi:MAG: hypothetical protein DHS20C19_22300 [Acidimicrobiales bacterium]|nr:MAG: hypothetical protein DHS20C19_22300 [Acidimicrobiales bacterium]
MPPRSDPVPIVMLESVTPAVSPIGVSAVGEQGSTRSPIIAAGGRGGSVGTGGRSVVVVDDPTDEDDSSVDGPGSGADAPSSPLHPTASSAARTTIERLRIPWSYHTGWVKRLMAMPRSRGKRAERPIHRRCDRADAS